jgi:hypothetical protein
VRWADGDDASGPEKQWRVREKGNNHRDPKPNVLAKKLFCFVTIADPAPVLSQHSINTRPQLNYMNKGLTPTGL